MRSMALEGLGGHATSVLTRVFDVLLGAKDGPRPEPPFEARQPNAARASG